MHPYVKLLLSMWGCFPCRVPFIDVGLPAAPPTFCECFIGARMGRRATFDPSLGHLDATDG